jgi:hypothetical protein
MAVRETADHGDESVDRRKVSIILLRTDCGRTGAGPGGVSKHHPHFCPGWRATVSAIGYGPFIPKIVIADQGV